MRWNLEHLREKSLIISNKIKNSNDPNEIEYLKQELLLIESMIEFLVVNKPDSRKYKTEWIVTPLDCSKKIEFLTKYLRQIAFKLDFLSYSHRLPCYHFVKNSIDKETYIILVEEFLSNFEFDLLSIYKELVRNQAIHISNRYYYESFQLGVACYLPTFNQSYIAAIFNGKLNYISCLVHEIAHAYQFKGTPAEINESMVYSIFREAFPHFVELAFTDFLKHKGYYKNGMRYERSFIESMSIIMELYGNTYFNSTTFIDEKSFINGCNQVVSISDTSRLVSKLLACHFKYLYRNKANGIEMINQFNNMYRKGDEYLFFEEITLQSVIDSVREEFKSYYDNIYNQEKFKIDRKLG